MPGNVLYLLGSTYLPVHINYKAKCSVFCHQKTRWQPFIMFIRDSLERITKSCQHLHGFIFITLIGIHCIVVDLYVAHVSGDFIWGQRGWREYGWDRGLVGLYCYCIDMYHMYQMEGSGAKKGIHCTLLHSLWYMKRLFWLFGEGIVAFYAAVNPLFFLNGICLNQMSFGGQRIENRENGWNAGLVWHKRK